MLNGHGHASETAEQKGADMNLRSAAKGRMTASNARMPVPQIAASMANWLGDLPKVL
jgi:hypothetical protein